MKIEKEKNFVGRKAKKGITNCQVFCVHFFLIAWSIWQKEMEVYDDGDDNFMRLDIAISRNIVINYE